MLHELHRPGAHAHAAATRLLPVRPTQVRDAEQLLPGVRDVPALPGGEGVVGVRWKRVRSRRSMQNPWKGCFVWADSGGRDWK